MSHSISSGLDITDAAAEFFFPESTQWTSLTEVRIKDANGKSAGNIDIVLVAYDDRGHIFDFGALEVQAVYISGNIRRPFEFYLEDPERRHNMDWTKHSRYYPRPDYLSSSRKRLAPQLVYKGGILNAWKKRMAVALHSEFYKTMPKLPKVSRESGTLPGLSMILYTMLHRKSTSSHLPKRFTRSSSPRWIQLSHLNLVH